MQALRLLLVVLAALVAAPLANQTGRAAAQETALNFATWEADATDAEKVVAAAKASNRALDDLRVKIVKWRTTFDPLRAMNQAQIDSVKAQIADLGPPPAEGEPEAPGIVSERKELSERLAELQAPAAEAAAAYRRADGIIKQIDALIRQRQASELLRLMPSPANPLHWPSGGAVLSQGSMTLWTEVTGAWNNPVNRAQFRNRLPAIIVCLLLAGLLLWRSPGFMERLSVRLQNRTAMRARYVVSGLVSLGQVIVPVVGMLLVLAAIFLSSITGPRLEALVEALPNAALAFFGARWLASWIFPDESRGGIQLTDRPAEARFHVTIIGLLSAAEAFRMAFTTEVRPPLSQAAQAVWLAPLVCMIAIFTFRLGVLLRRQRHHTTGAAESVHFRNRLIGFAGTAMVAVSIVAPLLAVIGYVTAANALIWPLVNSMGLIGLIILLHRFLTEIYVAITRAGDEGREALIPVLTGFFLVLAAIPLFALIWGARMADLSEVWTRIQAGVTLGDARISPAAILTLFVVFGLGYMVTRLIQGAMRSSVLPRTKLDKGAQSAVVSGLGYFGIFISALSAITTAGIDLSALAIVAGALSVGIGFGLQNIVQNFIAGIILLIERPITEGDSIEVKGMAGTVKAISVRSTRLTTGDQAEIVVPNAEFISGIVTNWTSDSLRGRIVAPVTVAYGTDTRKVERILLEIVEAHPLVLIDPEPSVLLVGLGQDGINFEIRAILSDLNFKLNVQSDVYHQVLERFSAEGIEIPLGQQKLLLRHEDSAPAPARPQPKRPKAATRPAPFTNPADVNNDPASDPDERERE